MAKSLKGLKKLVGGLSKSDKSELAKSMKDSSVVKMAGGGEAATMKSGVVKLGMGGAPKSGVMKKKLGGAAKSGVMKKKLGGAAKSGVKKLGRGGKLKK
jgi:hypothetical protein